MTGEEAASAEARSQYEPAVDGLRAVAVMAVLLFHYEVGGFTGGFVGVDVFFVISGYVISKGIRERVTNGRFSVLDFYVRRVRRIFPAMLVTVALAMVAGVRKLHRLHELADPTDHFEVDIALRRARRLKPQRPGQALGISAAIRDQLLAACEDSLIGLRDRVMVSVGFDTLCRRSELVALAAEDLSPNHFGSLSILVRRSKNDPYGTGRIAHLAKPTVAVVEEWLEATGIERGRLLRPVYHGHPIPASWSRSASPASSRPSPLALASTPRTLPRSLATPSASAPPNS